MRPRAFTWDDDSHTVYGVFRPGREDADGPVEIEVEVTFRLALPGTSPFFNHVTGDADPGSDPVFEVDDIKMCDGGCGGDWTPATDEVRAWVEANEARLLDRIWP